jgi:uncharacterized protein (UPF0333 family)
LLEGFAPPEDGWLIETVIFVSCTLILYFLQSNLSKDTILILQTRANNYCIVLYYAIIVKYVAMESHKHFGTSNTKKSIYRYTLNQFWANITRN